MELTEVKFWEDYWKKCELSSAVDQKFSFDRCLAYVLSKQLSDWKGEVFKIGCAPGKWLFFMAKELGLRPSGIEYSKAGMEITLKESGTT